MLSKDIPGFGRLDIKRIVSDYTGTHAFQGLLRPSVKERLVRLADLVEIHVLTSDTFGPARRELEGIPVQFQQLAGNHHDEQSGNMS